MALALGSEGVGVQHAEIKRKGPSGREIAPAKALGRGNIGAEGT